MDFSSYRPYPSSIAPAGEVAPIVGMTDNPMGDMINVERHDSFMGGQYHRMTPSAIGNVSHMVQMPNVPTGHPIDARNSHFTYVAGSQNNYTTIPESSYY